MLGPMTLKISVWGSEDSEPQFGFIRVNSNFVSSQVADSQESQDSLHESETRSTLASNSQTCGFQILGDMDGNWEWRRNFGDASSADTYRRAQKEDGAPDR